MSRSLGFALYALMAGRRADPPTVWPDRPAGSLIWLNGPPGAGLRSLLELARNLHEAEGYAVLLTTTQPVAAPVGLTRIDPPGRSAAAAAAFFDHWRPAIAVLADGELPPLMLEQAARRAVPVLLVDARRPILPGGPGPFWPGVLRRSLAQVEQVFAVDEPAARLFRRKGAGYDRVRVAGRMDDGQSVLPCTEAERAALVRQFQTRPVWLAAGLPQAEDAAVIGAHRAALRLAHRLLLILVPDPPERADALGREIEAAEGWSVARRSADEEPDVETEVFLADVPAEMGLWYRLAPVTYLGGSLSGDGSRHDPFEAAALGSAILHGPRAGAWQTALNRLTDARATRAVAGATDLAEGLADLLAPDRAARLAQAAWAVTSAGAEVTDKVILAVRQLMAAGR